MKKFAILAAIGLATACAAPEPTYRDLEHISRDFQRQNTDTCGVAQHTDLIGEPAAQIDRASLPPRTRFIDPDTLVTQDFVTTRLNVMIDAEGVVTELRCF